jgi:hypothetical protein
LGDYALDRRIGAGSYGDVWLARDAVGKHVAVKVIDRERLALFSTKNREERGLRLARTQLPEHPHLIRIHHVGNDGPRLYYVMDLADDAGAGKSQTPVTYRPRTLADDVKGGTPLAVPAAINIVRQLLGAVKCLHEHGIVHRDIKPSNIIAVDGVWKLADVGLLAEEATEITAVGTPDFMPPTGKIDRTADLYALGKLLYCLVTGNPPRAFPKIPRPLLNGPQQHAIKAVNAVITRACSLRAEQRYASADSLDAALAECLRKIESGQTDRHPRRRAVLFTGVTIILIGVAVASWLGTRGGHVPVAGTDRPVVLHVDSAAPPRGDGRTWRTAYRHLQDALATTAGNHAAEIRIAGGTYRPTEDGSGAFAAQGRSATFRLPPGVMLRGGYAGVDNLQDPDERDLVEYETILSGDVDGEDEPGMTGTNNSLCLVVADGVSETGGLDGLTLAYAYGQTAGGVRMLGGAPTIAHCRFLRNYADRGGAVHMDSAARPYFSDCTFEDNHTTYSDGGALFIGDHSTPRFERCAFLRNHSWAWGGAAAVWDGSAPTFSNCLIAGNSARHTGAIHVCESHVTLINCTIADNRAEKGTGGIFIRGPNGPSGGTLTNCILWGNYLALFTPTDNTAPSGVEDPQIVASEGGVEPPAINYCCVQGWTGQLGGAGNFGLDPLFVRPLAAADSAIGLLGDYHLSPDSPCIDAGDPEMSGAAGLVDLTGRERVQTGRQAAPRIDLGAYEWAATNAAPPP